MLIIRQLFKMYLHNDNIKMFGKKKHTQFYHVYDIIIFFLQCTERNESTFNRACWLHSTDYTYLCYVM